jgi:hypothetical protein
MTFRFAFNALHFFGKRDIINKWGKVFYKAYKKLAIGKLSTLENELPQSVHKKYDFNYKLICAYVPIYDSLQKLGVATNEIETMLWKMNESALNAIPKKLFKMIKPSRKALDQSVKYQQLGESGVLGKNEWIMKIQEDADGSIHTRFTQCGAYNVLSSFGYGFVFPCACRLDYLTANIAGMKFVRNKTIGDGDGVCDNHYLGKGFTEWAPEKGFIGRK